MSRQSTALKQYCQRNGIKNTELQELLGFSSGNISSMLNGRYNISKDAARKLADKYGFSLPFLILGEGELFAPQTANGNSAPVIQQQGQNCTGSITTETAKDRIIEQLTESNRELVANNTRLCDMMSRALDKLSEHLAGPAGPKTAK